MNGFELMRKIFPAGARKKIKESIPGPLAALYERYYILNTLKLKHYYQKQDDSLHIHNAVFPLKIFTDPVIMYGFNSEYGDIIYPFIMHDEPRVKPEKYIDGPYILNQVQLEKGDVVIDCGANLGLFSAMASGLGCASYAFEPLPANLGYLRELVAVNPNIRIVESAIGNQNTPIRFTASDTFHTDAKFAEDSDEGTISVPCTTLDEFVRKEGLQRVDFIKADIEGAERQLLQGAQHVLKEFGPKISLCTYHLPDDPEVLRQLIIEANPNYVIFEAHEKIYAYIPRT